MSHMVIFQTPDGNPGYNQFETVEEAVSFVEKLRNDQSIDNARMFALEEIKFELKPLLPGRAPGADAGHRSQQPDRLRQSSGARTAARQRADTAAGAGGQRCAEHLVRLVPASEPRAELHRHRPPRLRISPARRPSRFVAVCSVADRAPARSSTGPGRFTPAAARRRSRVR